MPSTETQNSDQGSVYRLLVRNAEEAVQTIRERFGPGAKVLSVRQQEGHGLFSLFQNPKLEVLVQVGGSEASDFPALVDAEAAASAAPAPQAKPAVAERKAASPAKTSSKEELAAAPLPAASPPATPSDPAAKPEASPSQVPAADPGKPKTTAAAPTVPGMEKGSAAKEAKAKVPSEPQDPEDGTRISIKRSDFRSAPHLDELLRRSGFSEAFLARIATLPSWARRYDHPLHITLVELGKELRKMLSERKQRPLPKRSLFLGSRGVGRTTALCKWLGAEVFARGRSGRVLKVEFDQPNSTEQLAVYCEALGLGLEHYSEDLSLDVPSESFLYADVPGFSFARPGSNQDLGRLLKTGLFEGRVLVLNALHDQPALRAAYAVGRDLGATHLVFTHCDELLHWGKLVDFLIDGELTPLFLATGPSLSGDCEEDVLGTVLRKTIPGS